MKLSEAIRAKLLLKFRNLFEFVNMSNLEKTLFALRINGEAAVSHLTKGDAAEISK